MCVTSLRCFASCCASPMGEISTPPAMRSHWGMVVVPTTGIPVESASITTRGCTSLRDARTRASLWYRSSRTCWRLRSPCSTMLQSNGWR